MVPPETGDLASRPRTSVISRGWEWSQVEAGSGVVSDGGVRLLVEGSCLQVRWRVAITGGWGLLLVEGRGKLPFVQMDERLAMIWRMTERN